MILTFRAGPEIVHVKIDDERRIQFKGRATGPDWVDIDKLYEAGKKQGDSEQAVRVTKAIVHDLKKIEDIEYYIRYEFARHGLTHLKTEWTSTKG